MNRQIFFDPQRKRWKRLRRILDTVAVFSTLILVLFFLNVVKNQQLPELLLPTPKRNYRAIREQAAAAIKAKYFKGARRKTSRKPSEIPFNSGESLRAAYYVDDDAGSFASLKSHIHQIDMLFPDWLYVTRADGTLEGAFTAEAPLRAFPVLDAHGVHSVDPQNKVHDLIAATHEDLEIFPELKNYNVLTQEWDQHATAMLKNPGARFNLERQVMTFLAANPSYRGLSLDLEDLPDDAQADYHSLIGELYALMHPKNLKLFVNEGVGADDSDFAELAQQTDGILLMNYDQHEETGGPGPIAAQDWFEDNLKRVLKVVPKEKLICSIGNYGYDWTMSLPKGRHATAKVLNTDDISVQDGWQAASDANADVRLAGDELNPHFAYDDEDNHVRHQVWMLDAVTALNELRAARQMGVQTIALWRLGREDASLWSIWDHPSNVTAPQSLKQIPPGDDVVSDGDGDIVRITGEPHPGSRTIDMDSYNWTVTDEHMLTYPSPYAIEYYGYKPGVVALSFDDGPDPKWTPKVLDLLKQQNVKATFMMIGEQAQDNVGLMKRVMAEGHEIGNHTWTHPDISEISPRQMELELNLTERLFGSKLGVKPLYFRPPYSIDQEPDTNDQTAPAYLIQKMGYTIVGNKIDTGDWDERQRKTPEGILNDVLVQLDLMKTKPQFRGSIILMHDGGGDRSVTIAALPVLIAGLRAHGYVFEQVSDLMGKTRAEVMPPLNAKERWQARVDSVAFFAWAFFNHFVVSLFFLGDILMSARLILVGIFALIDRLRARHTPEVAGGFLPRVAVLIPAYNEEKVIVRTIRSVLNSDYPHLRVIVIDDGSADRTSEVAREAYPEEIAAGMLTVLRTANGGKAEALNFAVTGLEEEFYVGIDADTVIAADAVSKLVCHFADPKIGAVAGNAKVGNRVNLWTRWQALEYITSQNFERRALDLFDVVTVVPGAIGAWRTEAVRQGGCYPVNTVAEDADLTMNLLEQGYKVIYEDRALAFTEAPATARGLMRQRFRWSFGTLQAVYKHQAAFLRNKAMGLFALPNILVFQILLPLVSPFIDLMFVAGVVHYLIDRHFHPETANAANFEKLLTFFLAFLIIDFVTSALAFSLERRHAANKGDGWLLFHIWLQRFAYRQLFSLVLFKTVKRAIDGRPFNWDKLERTAKMSAQTERLTATR
jgi:cellulose synthase/poly-beta-1,6-N-acetylglucosamine synthase-like glycosyltransferase/peptidoglycan/xylan/chitin deacetylase (PgdA/CDA1 family)/spore germination protein YaaH